MPNCKKVKVNGNITLSVVNKFVGKHHTIPNHNSYKLGERMKEYQPKEEDEECE